MRGCSYSKTYMSCIWHRIDSQFKKYHHRIAPYAIPIINRIESNRIKSIFEKIKVRWPRFDKCANILSGFWFSKIVPPFYFVWFLWNVDALTVLLFSSWIATYSLQKFLDFVKHYLAIPSSHLFFLFFDSCLFFSAQLNHKIGSVSSLHHKLTENKEARELQQTTWEKDVCLFVRSNSFHCVGNLFELFTFKRCYFWYCFYWLLIPKELIGW